MTKNKLNRDIYDGIAAIRHAFMSADLKPPTVILLESHEEGVRMLSAIRQSANWSAIIGSPDLGLETRMADGSTWMEIKIMGIAIRWPANRLALPDGSWRYV